MKKIILLILIPFAINAQNISEIKTIEVKDSSLTKNLSPAEKSKKEAWEKLEGYRQMVISGKVSMNVAAALYSQDPGSAKRGGEIDNVVRGRMVKEFEDVAFSLKEGEISEIFETKFGFHFIELISAHGEALDLRHILIIPK